MRRLGKFVERWNNACPRRPVGTPAKAKITQKILKPHPCGQSTPPCDQNSFRADGGAIPCGQKSLRARKTGSVRPNSRPCGRKPLRASPFSARAGKNGSVRRKIAPCGHFSLRAGRRVGRAELRLCRVARPLALSPLLVRVATQQRRPTG
jgi:hypothetical protein